MPVMHVILEGDNCWPELRDWPFEVHHTTKAIQVAVLEGGMKSGRPSVCFRIDLNNGDVVMAETSAQLFCGAAKMLMAKYPNLFE